VDAQRGWGLLLGHTRGHRLGHIWDFLMAMGILFTVRRVDLATRQSKATWNLWVAALDKLYQIGVDEGLVAANPFPRGLRSVRGRYGRAVERNLAYEPDGGQRPVKYLSLDQYRRWRNVGLLGTSAPLPRLRERNAAFADLLLATGLRLQEAACLLAVEVADEAIGTHRFDLGASHCQRLQDTPGQRPGPSAGRAAFLHESRTRRRCGCRPAHGHLRRDGLAEGGGSGAWRRAPAHGAGRPVVLARAGTSRARPPAPGRRRWPAGGAPGPVAGRAWAPSLARRLAAGLRPGQPRPWTKASPPTSR
jgi:hypothetical protein